ncbi:hypothetical protein PVAND_002201 [Polypedilum vanderplanki]|uniref:Ricin B lectin domain-containing protein n=1 Tax=Polypedilum vanderplanki TaxID=319348 RepID=A0A9J6BQJ7_POLVA|nr:hypothetical protein PVAND_002201 [Polypedilum vanderplanki]
MFEYQRYRNHHRRQIKTILKIIIFITLLWWLFIFGFRQNENDIDNGIVEQLDRNQIEKSNLYAENEDQDKEALELEKNQDEIMKEFLHRQKENMKFEEEKIKKEISFGSIKSALNNMDLFSLNDLLGDYAKEIRKEDFKEIFGDLSNINVFDVVGKANNFIDNAKEKIENESEKPKEKEKAIAIKIPQNEIIIHKKEETTIKDEEQNLEDSRPDEIVDEEKEPFGHYGKAVTLPSDIPENIKKLVEEGWKNHEFNEYVSNLIPINRTLRDFRSDYCRDMQNVYSKNVPKVSIVMVFHNEAWSTLMRSIQSILNRTPEEVIHEIILVDDCSTMEHLKVQLDEFVKTNIKIRLIRLPERKGLIYARNIGASEAKSEILVFLDSHIECTKGWIEPLIDRVILNATTIAVPVIEIINDQTFALEPKDHPTYVTLGGFSWNLQFRWFHKQTSELKEPQAPIKSPTMAGGLFAIASKFFKHLGMYDPDLDLWGGENLELSFKAWMCGGSIEIIPCSHVGHVFRKKSPYVWRTGVDVLRKNSLRVAKVWMDDYAVFYNYATGFEKTDYGNISARVKLRQDLQCKSFRWYLKNVYPEKKVPSEGIAYGQIQNLGYGAKMCLDGKAAKDSPSLTVKYCHGLGGNQFWQYDGEIARDNYCVTYDAHNLMTQHCKRSSKQLFTYDPDEKQIYIHHSETVEIDSEERKLNEKFKASFIVNLVKPPLNVFGNNVVVGELGEPVHLPSNLSDEIKKLIDDGWKKHEFNQYISDLISVKRTLNDFRIDECKNLIYLKELPQTSVIITFYNEAWSTLLRTVHSVLDRGGDHVLEVILVDDFSDMVHLKDPLDSYFKNFHKVKIIRMSFRVGLIKSRINGFLESKGEIVTFLDSHCECADGWLEPLLAKVAEDNQIVVVPVIDTIDVNTFEYQWIKSINSIPIGGFDWTLNFKWALNFVENQIPTLPIRTPVMSGGLFAINRHFFIRLGLYDPELDIWGGENLELSFKTWMCGGTLEIIPCSHVGHVFRSKSPYNKDIAGRNAMKRNLIRVAQVWMDDYAKFFLMRIHARENDYTDVSMRLFKKEECKSFKWYLQNIYPSQFDVAEAIAQGKMRNSKFNAICLEMNAQSYKLEKCRDRREQFIVLTDKNELRRDDYCLSLHKNGQIKLDYCFGLESEHVWQYDKNSHFLKHTLVQNCLSIDIESNSLIMENCSDSIVQQWTFDFIKNFHY